MRIAIHNSFIGQHAAENEISRRICLAAENIGWQANTVISATEIKEYSPDFVIVTHFDTPKLSEFPTYGCMWNPPVFMEKYEDWIKELNKELLNAYFDYPEFYFRYKNILSYDAYLVSSSQIEQWLELQLLKKDNEKKYFFTPFFTSCNATEYVIPNIQEPNLAYMGTNWDGKRFKQLFKQLDRKAYMEIYGSKWDYLKKSFRGTLPFDGVSVLNKLRLAGVGLCLHKPEHCQAETPSMRIFEIIASGALAICGEHKFIREAFGNSVLYIDTEASVSEQVKQISNHIDWIRNHQTKALEMSKAAHDIFIEKYTLEKLLLGIIPHHQELIRSKGFITSVNSIPEKQVQFIVRLSDRPLVMLKRCLDSIANQTYKNVSVILVNCQEVTGLDELLQRYEQIITIKIVNSEYTDFKSTHLKKGISAVTSEYFAILDDTAIIYPNHVYILTSLLEKYKFIDVIYSGLIRAWEDANSLKITDKDLVYFENFDIKKIAKFQNFITTNSFIAKSSLISDIYQVDPKLQVGQDFFLILELCRKAIFLFSYEATCEFYWRIDIKDSVTRNQLQNCETLVTTKMLKDIKPDIISDQLLQIFKDQEFIVIDNFDLNREIKPKFLKLSELRYSKSQQLLQAELKTNSFSFYKFLRSIYLRLSRGGKFNKNPSIISKCLVLIKKLLLE
ncbi:glycosyl transferase [Synechococcus sp. PCC 7502]|uniref:glycosyltransferase n=1 Tax=Synechococcus sp. PCC 7502 TaxID=1173263 RepID=UPI00029FEF72|nr:glycosyltransferase family 2 protein [Synechococcus sp. PCC 7502]AFY75129.1 glycosyl transferase [Synechococcus sp. PCC 7502]